MDRIYRYIGWHLPEFYALFSSAIVLISGSYLSWYYNPVWLNRTGSLVIIIGVLLAASRFHEWVQQKAMDYVDANFDKISEDALSNAENDTVSLTKSEREEVRSSIKVELNKDFHEFFEKGKRRLKIWEIYLVVGGTFLNGFGDYIVTLFKSP